MYCQVTSRGSNWHIQKNTVGKYTKSQADTGYSDIGPRSTQGVCFIDSLDLIDVPTARPVIIISKSSSLP